MKQTRWFAVAVAVGTGLASTSAGSAGPPGEFNPPDESLYAEGRYVYQRHCAVCHGPRGDGQGEMARGMFPSPRPFTFGVFKYRSTPSGYLPTTDDIIWTVRAGIAGTSMPAFTALSGREVRAAAEYIKFFSPRWSKRENHAPPVVVPSLPDWWAAENRTAWQNHAEKGQQLFITACSACHGADGSGDGPASSHLMEDWEQPIRLPDLRREPFRTGSSPADLHRVLLTGINGTPMPSYAESLTPDERWDLVAYLLSLQGASP